MLLIASLLAGCSDLGTAANEAKLRQTPDQRRQSVGDNSTGLCDQNRRLQQRLVPGVVEWT